MDTKKREKSRKVLLPLWLFAACSLEFLQLQTGLLALDQPILAVSGPCFLLNLSLLVFIHLLLRLISGRWSVSFYLTAFFFFLWAAADYYTIYHHGSPLFFSELGNVQAALTLAGSYKFHFHWIPALNFLIFWIEILISYFLCRYIGRQRRKPLLFAGLSTVSLLTFMTGFYLLHILVNDYILGWKWYDSVRGYGFICCAAEDFCNTIFPYTSDHPFRDNPILALEKDYNKACTRTSDGSTTNTSPSDGSTINTRPSDDGTINTGPGVDSTTNTRPGDGRTTNTSALNPDTTALPDLILILNESFYDLAVRSEIQTDQDYLKDYYSIQGALYGFAECPNIGGRTNDSEYELLTGCSMDRLRASAPFNYLDLTRGPSLVRFLKRLGYETTAMHCGHPGIYSRDTGYRQLGFDHVILGREHFPHHSWNGRREWLDEDNYKDLISYYEKQGSGPRFFYLMTYQNHGSYDQNERNLDSVHPDNLAGKIREETAEYLSSALLSAQAIHWLTDYFAHKSRPVVICMIGDHAPPLISQLPPRSQDREAGLRQVPFMLWNNAGIDFSSDLLGQPADQVKADRDHMRWKGRERDMTQVMADLMRCLLH